MALAAIYMFISQARRSTFMGFVCAVAEQPLHDRKLMSRDKRIAHILYMFYHMLTLHDQAFAAVVCYMNVGA